MFLKKIHIFVALLFLNSCTGYTPIYKESIDGVIELQNLAIVTDNKKTSNSMRKFLIKLLPIRKKINYILKIETTTTNSGTVSNIDTKISGYEIQTELNASLYVRKDFDKLIYRFKDKRVSPYNLATNEVLSTITSRERAEKLAIKRLSQDVYDKLIIFFIQRRQNAN